MKASFDGVRIKLADDFNALASSGLSENQKEILKRMRNRIVALVCMYDDDDGDDCHDLSDAIDLKVIT